jgi:hypothetical protein
MLQDSPPVTGHGTAGKAIAIMDGHAADATEVKRSPASAAVPIDAKLAP